MDQKEDKSVLQVVKSNLPNSTRTGRKSGKTNAGLELLSLAPNKYLTYGIGAVPIKTMQTLVSLYAAFHVDTNITEKLLHIGQATLTCGLITLNIMIFLRGEDCQIPGLLICQLDDILEMIYLGTVFAALGAGEMLKAKSPTPLDPENPLFNPGRRPSSEAESLIQMRNM